NVDGKKTMKITGPFLLKNEKNRNGRIYPGKVMDAAVEKYIKDYVKTNRALGEMNHPDRITIDPERACILTEDLQKDGNYYIGKAKVLSTPLGKLLANLLEDGVKIGVSSRGLGSITKKDGAIMVKEDYEIRTAADVVFDPSVATAFIDILMEDVHYIKYGELLVERDLYESKERIKKASMSKLEEQKLKEFQNFLNKISLG
ncbi:MAG TPA: hypothetical protein VFM18_13755, partial [Methanosarcina sp.]|nr:hypothetical protein [Methanosarcina sp.]